MNAYYYHSTVDYELHINRFLFAHFDVNNGNGEQKRLYVVNEIRMNYW